MDFLDCIIKKRDGKILTTEEIEYFVQGVTKGTIPDYQISAMLMAIYFQGLSSEETGALTIAMANSGKCFQMTEINGIKVDKHSTGGVADTSTLVLAPLVASLGVPVIKMSGRGLGFSGGTIDKLEAIPGFQTSLTEEAAIKLAKQNGLVIMGQTKGLTPADKILYALRDVTGTVESLPLIASSIMSKKIAAGADAIVLDVKCGSGAFMKDLISAQKLGREMVSIGKQTGKKVSAVITSMAQPLGNYIGNALEVREAIEVLRGNVKGDLLSVSLELGSHMLLLANRVKSLEEGKSLLLGQIQNGEGLRKFCSFIQLQGGNPKVTEDLSLLPHSKCTFILKSKANGFLSSMDTSAIGRASIETGAGRLVKDDIIDPGAGIIMRVRFGDQISIGDPLAEIFASTMEQCESAAKILLKALTISQTKPSPISLILDTIDSSKEEVFL